MSTSDVSACRSSAASMPDTCAMLAAVFAVLRSKDPNTRVGACVYNPKTEGMYLGYNGFNHGTPNYAALWDARTSPVLIDGVPMTKYDVVAHAEKWAIQKALAACSDLADAELFVTHYPCRRCMVEHIQPSGIRSVKFLNSSHFDPVSHWVATRNGITVEQMGSLPSTREALERVVQHVQTYLNEHA